jgi:uncharacterized protein (DUF1778 family)
VKKCKSLAIVYETGAKTVPERKMMNARVSEDKVDVIDEMADERDMTRSDFLRHLVDNAIESQKSEELQEYADTRGIDLLTAQRQIAFEHFEQDTRESMRDTHEPHPKQQPTIGQDGIVELFKSNKANLYGIAFVALSGEIEPALTAAFGTVAGGLIFVALAALVIAGVVGQNVISPLLDYYNARGQDSDDAAAAQTTATRGAD